MRLERIKDQGRRGESSYDGEHRGVRTGTREAEDIQGRGRGGTFQAPPPKGGETRQVKPGGEELMTTWVLKE